MTSSFRLSLKSIPCWRAAACTRAGLTVSQATRKAVIEGLLAAISSAEVALRVRIAAGEVLGYLGDPRLGEFVSVPAGEFTMGDNSGSECEQPQHSVFLRDYQIGKYPLTNSEFAEFIQAGGYEDSRWWTDAGWDARKKEELDCAGILG